MRLDGQRESANYEVQRGGGGFRGSMGGMGGSGIIGLLLPIIGRKFGCMGIVVALGVILLLNAGPSFFSGGSSAPAASGSSVQEAGQISTAQSFSLKVLASTEDIWGELYRRSGAQYKPTVLSFYQRSGQSGCGAAQSAMGPFYCPVDQKIYLDTDFYHEMENGMGARGDFAQAYVIAHEVGHHIQDLEGTLTDVNRAQRQLGQTQGNALQVRVELQADCYAGVWGRLSGLMEAGDLQEGLRAANAIGDDTLQRSAGQRPMPDSFTHGSSEQRMAWLKRGLDSGDPSVCNTLNR